MSCLMRAQMIVAITTSGAGDAGMNPVVIHKVSTVTESAWPYYSA